MAQLCASCNPSEESVHIQFTEDDNIFKFLIDMTNQANITKELIQRDEKSHIVSFCLLKCLIPNKIAKVKVEEVLDSIERQFVVDYFNRSSGNSALKVGKVEKISNRAVQLRFLNELKIVSEKNPQLKLN